MRYSKILAYLLYVCLLFGFLAAATWATSMIRIWVGRTLQPIPGYIGSNFIFIFIGLLVGLEHFVTECRKQGKWSIHITKLIIIGIPSFICAFSLALAFIFTIPIPSFIFKIPITNFVFQNIFFTHVSAIILGYTLITSFDKKPILTAECENE